MKAIILAAGEGKRLRPFTETMPKVMLPICNKPLLEYVIDSCKKSGISEIVLVVGYKKEAIMEHFKDYKGVTIDYVFQEKQLGTAHALLQAKSKIKSSFVVIPGDNIIDSDSLSKLIEEKSKYSILIKEHTHPSKYGVVFLEKNNLRRIVEKPREEIGKFISTGIYKFPKDFIKKLEDISSEGVHALSSAVQNVIDSGEEISTVKANLWADIVYPWDLINVNEAMIRNLKSTVSGTIEKGVTIKGSVSIGKDTKIYAGTYIVGPVVIGKGCEIGPNACIFPSTTVGDYCVLNPFTEIRNSVIMDEVRIDSNSSVIDTVIGEGTTIANNFSSISGKAVVEIDDEFKKLENIGSILGGDCRIKSHVVLDPGVVIGRKCDIDSQKRITKNLPSLSKVI